MPVVFAVAGQRGGEAEIYLTIIELRKKGVTYTIDILTCLIKSVKRKLMMYC